MEKHVANVKENLVPHRQAQRRWPEAKASLPGLTAFTPLSFCSTESSVSAPLWNSLDHFGSSWSYLELGIF